MRNKEIVIFSVIFAAAVLIMVFAAIDTGAEADGKKETKNYVRNVVFAIIVIAIIIIAIIIRS